MGKVIPLRTPHWALQKPYTHRRKPWGCRSEVLFEDTPVFELNTIDADDIVKMLNAAYVLGFGSGMVHGEFEKEKAT